MNAPPQTPQPGARGFINGAIASAARRTAVAIVDLEALRSNFATLATASGTADCAAVVKGDGYGLGMLTVTKAAWQAGARWYFVARFEDGAILRHALPQARIAVLDGMAGRPAAGFEQARLLPVLSTLDDCRRWLDGSRTAPCLLHLDTAMNRLGLKAPEIAAIAPLLRSAAHQVAAYLTHLAAADDGDRELCRQQVSRFEAALAGLPPAPRSIANSAGLFLDPAWHADLTRPGKALYGINPAQPGEPVPVAPVLSVLAPILQVGDVATGDSIGYSATFRAARPMRIATLGIGYANGYLRALSNTGVVAFAGHRAAVVGRVSMDLVTVDVTHLSDAVLQAGYAEMLGPTIGLGELASLAGSNEYELQIALGRGCHRIYTGEQSDAD